MDFPSIINKFYICVSCLVTIVALGFLTIALLYRHRCFNFATLLSCNTAATVLFHATNHIAVSLYMLVWDQYSEPTIDLLCPLRAYFHHSTAACIYHSFLLLAIEKYCKIHQLDYLKTRRGQICLVLSQWIFDFSFTLPVLLTGNMVKVESDNFCFVSLRRVDLLLYQSIISFLIPDICLSIIYRLLIRHVRQVSSKLNKNQQLTMQRDLKMTRRIVLLNSQLVIIGIPILVLVILNIIRSNFLPNKTLRILITVACLPYTPMLIILLFLTPDLRQSMIECQNKIIFYRSSRVGPVQTIAAISRCQQRV